MEPLPVETRRSQLAALVAERGFLRVTDGSTRFGVSEVTLRADLRALEQRGLVHRTHGGATAQAPGREAPVEHTVERDADLKRAIGEAAAGLVRSGSSILLDVGSTTLAVAHALVDRLDLVDLVVITNGLSIALALESAIPRFAVIVTGGTLRPLQHSLVNPIAASTIATLHVDLAILGCNGIDADGRVTNVNLPEAEVKRAMLAAATERMLVADASKSGQRHLGLVGELPEFDVLVTGGPGADTFAATAQTFGTRVVLAP